MSRLTHEQLQRKMEAIRELKQEYCIGSRDAFYYLKVVNCYEELCEKIRKDSSIIYKPSLREMSFLCNGINVCARNWLHSISVLSSTTEDLSLTLNHYVVTSTDMPDSDLSCDQQFYVWAIDVPMVLQRILADVSELPSRGRLMELFFRHAEFMNCFTIEETKQRVFGSEIVKNPNFRKGNERYFWQFVEYYIRDGGLEEKELLDLQQANNANDIEMCHKIMQQICLHEVVEDVQSWLSQQDASIISAPTKEESVYLLQSVELIRRAEREFTLGHYEVERKVAISYVYGFAEWTGSKFESIPDLIDGAMKYESNNIRRYKKRLEHLRSLNASDEILETDQRMVREAKYLHASLY